MPPRKRVLTPPGLIQNTQKTPPPSNRKLAIAGSFPEHCYKAPFDDPSWELWAMSAGRWKKYPRWDLWFELHHPRTYPRYERKAEGYIDFVKREAVTYDRFPFQKLLDEFGPYFFTTGQITWLLAYAIHLKFDVIGIWGVEAVGEYSPTLLDKPKLYAYSAP
jgi:hypothetical protein